MVRIGGFLKPQNRIRRQRTRGRLISPYQVGGTILWQVHHGALSVDVHVLPPVGALEADPFETMPQDERGNHFWQVHTNALSVEGPACLSRKRQMVDDHGPTPKRYEKDTPLNAVDSQDRVAQFV